MMGNSSHSTSSSATSWAWCPSASSASIRVSTARRRSSSRRRASSSSGKRAGHIGVRVAAPERERGAEPLRGLGGIGLHECGRMLDRPLELDGVHLCRIGCESIAAVVADDDVADRGSEVRDVRLQRRARAGGRLVAPDAVDQRVDRDRLPHLRSQQREHRALLRAAEPDVGAVAQDFERPEDANFQRRTDDTTLRRACLARSADAAACRSCPWEDDRR